MTPVEFIIKEIKEEIQRVSELEEERLKCKDYAGALRRESEREAYLRAHSIACIALGMERKEESV